MTILLIPVESYRAALLDPSMPFAHVPTAYRYDDWVPVDGWRPGEPSAFHVGGVDPGIPRIGLVLVWNGKVIAEGCDRAIRAHSATCGGHGKIGPMSMFRDYSRGDVEAIVLACEIRGIGVAVRVAVGLPPTSPR